MNSREDPAAADPAATAAAKAPDSAKATPAADTAAKAGAADTKAVKDPGTAKAEANEADPAKASAQAEAAAGKLVESGQLKGLPAGASGDSADKSKAQKEAEIADAANQVRPRPAPHPIPHVAADEAESARPATWAERVAAGRKSAPEILQEDGGSPAPRRQQGRLPPLVGPGAAAQMGRSMAGPATRLGPDTFSMPSPSASLPGGPEAARKARAVEDVRSALNQYGDANE